MKLDSLSPEHTVELAIGGMTCAACAARIERRLSKLDGVEASVNYATERAWVTGSQVLDLALLISTVENTGYQARTLDDLNDEPQDRSIDLERRLTLAIAFGTYFYQWLVACSSTVGSGSHWASPCRLHCGQVFRFIARWC